MKFLPFKYVCATYINYSSKKSGFLMCKDTHIIKPTIDRYGASFTKLTVDFFPELICNYFFSPETSSAAMSEFCCKLTVCHIFNSVIEKDKGIFTFSSNDHKKYKLFPSI